jgi:putative tricarboxylic transport membrane protein
MGKPPGAGGGFGPPTLSTSGCTFSEMLGAWPVAVGRPYRVPAMSGPATGRLSRVGGMVMVGAIIANKSPVKLAQATPIARLTGEFLALVVPAQSPFKSAKDFAAALKENVPGCLLRTYQAANEKKPS